MVSRVSLLVLIALIFSLFDSSYLFAQETASGIAIPVPINEEVQGGDLICSTDEG
jgi:hypothetical protein